MPATRRKRSQDSQPNGERQVTERVVLERVRVRVVDDAGNASGEECDAWVERGTFSGTPVSAIEQYAGKPGEPDAKVGQWKAPPARSLKATVVHSQPPLPKVERTVIR